MNNSICLIIPTYNRDVYLERAVKSVYNMPFDEIIIVDDGSTPKIIKWVETMLKNYPKIIYLKNKTNSGVGAAKNTGILYSKSDWICCLDDDDYYDRDVINDLKNFITYNNADIIYFQIKVLIENRIEYWGDPYPILLENLKNGNCVVNGSLFKRKVYDKINGFRLIPFEDWDFWIRTKQTDFKFIFYPEIFYTKDFRNDNTSLLYRDLEKINYDEWKRKYIND